MNKKRLLFIGLPIVLVLVIIVSVAMDGNGNDGISVQTEKVKSDRIVQTVTATGRIQPKTQVKISADVAAKIIGLHVKEGDWVEENQLLSNWIVNVLKHRLKVLKQICGQLRQMPTW